MASTMGPPQPPDRLSLESIPTVDLRLLSQSELTALSLCSAHAFDLRRCDDVVIPKIDRSVFNESAGSRKQTYSRLRLAPRNTSNSNSNLGSAPKPRATLSPFDTDNSRIISLFKSLFNGGNDAEIGDNVSALVPVNVEYSDAFLGGGDGGGGGERKRKRGRKPKSETTIADTSVSTVVTTVALVVDEEEKLREEERAKEEREREMVNRNGKVVDLGELGKKEDPYGEEIRRRTQGKESPEELFGFIRDLEGQWGSRRKKRKIVDANEFGDVLPNGWKVLIAMKKKQGQAWVFCRRYISPNGRYFVSCKEVSSYLLSLISPEDTKQQIGVQCTKNSMVNNKLASENATDLGNKIEYPSFCVTPQSNDHESQQKLFSTTQSNDHEKQLVLWKNLHPAEVQAASALKCHKCSTGFVQKDELLNHLLSCHKRKRRKSGAPIEDDVMMKDGKYECQFCSKLFNERSSYFGHVGIHVKNYVRNIGGSLGFAVTAKQKSSAVSDAEVPVTVTETVDNVEVNVVSVAAAPNILASSEFNSNVVDKKSEAGCEAETLSGNVKGEQNNFSLHAELKGEAAQCNKTAANESPDKQVGNAVATHDNVREVEEALVIKPDYCSGSEQIYNNENNDLCENLGSMDAAECVGSEIRQSFAVLGENNESCLLSVSKRVDIENDTNLAVNLLQREGVASENDVPVDDDEISLFSDSKQVDLGNDGNFAVNLLQRERVASESDFPAENNKENLSGDGISEGKSFRSKTVERNCFNKGLKNGDDDRLMDDSDSGLLDLEIDAADDVQLQESLDECSDTLHKEEETCGITANGVELMESPLADSNTKSSCTPSVDDQPATVLQTYVGKDFIGMANETDVNMCSLEDTEAIDDADRCIAQERSESCAAVLSKDYGCDHILNEAETVSRIKMVELRETGGCLVKQTCSLENSPREVSDRKGEETKGYQVMNSSNLFFASHSNDRHLAANAVSSNDQAHSNVSNVMGAFNNFAQDKQEQVTKSILSGLPIDEHMREVAMNNVTNVPSTSSATGLPELDKVDSSRSNKLIFDFGNISEMNARFLNSVQNETIPEGTSHFSLWGQQTCPIEDNQNRVYGGSRDGAQQERACDNNSLNLVGFQQPSDLRYNSNKVCMNEQGYGVQHNETGVYRKNSEVRREGIYSDARGIVQQERASDTNSLNIIGLQQSSNPGFNLNKAHMNEQRYGVQHNESGVYSKSNEARREGISHGNTLNLVGLHQQCDTGYNLNKPCISQQSYGLQCNDTGAYSTSDESKQERVTYGNSLSLASVPQTCETRYGLNKACLQQTCDTGFSLNKGHMGTMQGLSKLDELGHSRDQDLMVGFGNNGERPNQGVATDFLWRATEGNILPGGLMDSSSSQGHSSGSYQAFDFLSDKGGNDLYAANEKFDNISSFEGLRSTGVEPMEFSFMTTQESNAQLGHQKVLPFNAQMDQGFGSSVWHQKPTSLPNMMAGHVVSTLCVWCGNEFHQDSLGSEMQAGSIGYLCPTCKARMSLQFL